MPHLAQGGIQLGLEIGRRARLCPRRRSPPSVGGGKALFPGIQPVGADPQLLGDHFRGLAAGLPVVNGFALERFIEFTAGLNGCLCHWLLGSLSTQSSVRQFEATQDILKLKSAKGGKLPKTESEKAIQAVRAMVRDKKSTSAQTAALSQTASNPSAGGDQASKIQKLKKLLDDGLITQEEFQAEKTKALANL